MKDAQPLLYLASQSPRRREILTDMRVPFRVVGSSYEERLKQKVLPTELALEHAEGKARQGQVPEKARFVMGADTVVVCAGRILGKPRDEKAAVAMIQLLSGQLNEVITGVALLDRETGILTRAAAHSWVAIKKMNHEECLNYVHSSHPYDKAGGYAIQGKPRIARRIRGSYSNIVGCPRELVRRLLKQAGFFCFVGLLWAHTASAQTLYLGDSPQDTANGLCVGSHCDGRSGSPCDDENNKFSQACRNHDGVSAQGTGSGESARVRSAHTEASLVSEYTAVQPGKLVRVALRLQTDPDWHTYWSNSGDSGLATSLHWTLPEGFSAGPIQWPYPSLIRQDPLVTYGYHGEVWLFTTLQVPEHLNIGSRVILHAKADWLECEVPCLPGRANLSLELVVGSESNGSPEWQNGAAAFLAKIPKAVPGVFLTFEQSADALILKSNLLADEAYFFAHDGELFEHAALQGLSRDESGMVLKVQRSRLKPGLLQTLTGVLVVTAGGQKQAYEVNLTEKTELKPVPVPVWEAAPVPEPALEKKEASIQPKTLVVKPLERLSLAAALFFAFLGGLILNLMPCVLPVLSLKILGFVTQRGDAKQLRAHGLIWTLGVLVSFWLLSGIMLALRWGGSSLGWGFQLQAPGMVAALAVIFLLLTLNMAGFFEVGLLLTRYGGKVLKSGEKNGQAFAAGVLAVVAATPCTAPFMGAAMGYALTQPVPVVLAIFTSLGLGMAFPFLVLAFAPGGLKFLPKPGSWMNTFKKILALPLGLTVVWLLWVLVIQVSHPVLVGILAALALTAFSALQYGRLHPSALTGDPSARRKSRCFLALLSAGVGLTIGMASQGSLVSEGPGPLSRGLAPSEQSGVQWQVFSREEIDRLVQEGKPVFIDFTARWCLSCQVNDRLVFQTQEVADAFQARGIHAFKADWTSKDVLIAKALANYGRASVPLYVFYDGKSRTPRFLPEVLTVHLVLKALKES